MQSCVSNLVTLPSICFFSLLLTHPLAKAELLSILAVTFIPRLLKTLLAFVPRDLSFQSLIPSYSPDSCLVSTILGTVLSLHPRDDTLHVRFLKELFALLALFSLCHELILNPNNRVKVSPRHLNCQEQAADSYADAALSMRWIRLVPG